MDLFILGSLILLNRVLAMSELAIVTARKLQLRQWADRGDPAAAAALHLAEQPGPFLSTIQIGITAVGVFAGARWWTTNASGWTGS
ncbi:CNNM domain-containing protein [Pelomicrobium sp. G1]|uniref:CNNM domain-containing protein n=1 Tax=unclassified Pelomicrobium TaxID=2815318 RepID=UPI003F75B635